MKSNRKKSIFSSKISHFWISAFANKLRAALTVVGIFVCVVIMTVLVLKLEELHGETTVRFSEMPQEAAFLSGNIYAEELFRFGEIYNDIDVFQYKTESGATVNFKESMLVNRIGVGNADLSGLLLDLSSGQGVYKSKLTCGRAFSDDEVSGMENAVAINDSAAVLLFGKVNPLGKIVQIRTSQNAVIDYKIIATVKDSYHSLSTYYDFLAHKTTVYHINFYIPSRAMPSPANVCQNAVLYAPGRNLSGFANSAALSAGSVQSPFRRSSFSVTSYADVERSLKDSMSFFDKYMSLIYVIILCEVLTLAIFMIFSIKERVSEIGIRKAMGASNWDIMTQFIAEYQILGFIGTFVGILTGLFIHQMIRMTAYASSGFIVAMQFFPALLVVALFSMTIVLLLSLIPALIARRVKIIDSLRFV